MKLRYIFLSVFFFVIFSFEINAVDTSLKLYDNADLFSVTEEEKIKTEINEYIDKHNMDLVIVTTSINTYGNTESFLEHFYQDNNFGITSKKTGTIMAIDLDNGSYEYISFGEMQRYLDDNRIDEVYDYVDEMYNSNNKDYYVLTTSFIEQLDYYVSLGIPDSNKNTYVSDDGIMHIKKTFPFLSVFGIAILISSVVVFIIARKSKMIKKAVTANNYLDGKSVNITNRVDRFVTTHTTRVRKSSDSSSGGGRRVGGTTIRGNHSSGHGGRRL